MRIFEDSTREMRQLCCRALAELSVIKTITPETLFRVKEIAEEIEQKTRDVMEERPSICVCEDCCRTRRDTKFTSEEIGLMSEIGRNILKGFYQIQHHDQIVPAQKVWIRR